MRHRAELGDDRGERAGVEQFLDVLRIRLGVVRQSLRPYCFSMWARSFSFSVQMDSRMSLSGSRTSVTFMVNGLVYILASSMVRLLGDHPKPAIRGHLKTGQR
jgi:hypothetical protein